MSTRATVPGTLPRKPRQESNYKRLFPKLYVSPHTLPRVQTIGPPKTS